MKLTLRNETAYPTDEVRELVKFALREVEVPPVAVLVRHTRQSKSRVRNSNESQYWLIPYSGTAYDYVPRELREFAPKGTRYGVRLRIGSPDSGAFPMRRASWRNGWDQPRGEFPLFQHQTWQEALVAIAAHEFKHIEEFSLKRKSSELRCELFAKRVLGKYLQNGGGFYVSENGNELMTQLVAAASAVEGVELVPKNGYSIVKHGKTTIGYINGRRKIRVDLPMRDKVRANLHVETEADVAKAVAEMTTFIPPLEREANPDPKPSRKKATA